MRYSHAADVGISNGPRSSHPIESTTVASTKAHSIIDAVSTITDAAYATIIFLRRPRLVFTRRPPPTDQAPGNTPGPVLCVLASTDASSGGVNVF